MSTGEERGARSEEQERSYHKLDRDDHGPTWRESEWRRREERGGEREERNNTFEQLSNNAIKVRIGLPALPPEWWSGRPPEFPTAKFCANPGIGDQSSYSICDVLIWRDPESFWRSLSAWVWRGGEPLCILLSINRLNVRWVGFTTPGTPVPQSVWCYITDQRGSHQMAIKPVYACREAAG
ncbi:hypothetical protein C8F04DRAFT_1196080 [Mycena alexandri]|uniref:Uncharacterized protein n=1 Tax=Mycena alexandri TaxID=1745969 RepID=A0AAD6S4D9_9AGAR|nr:hypothetical protein C8F04DRAFT_1196080 [Mycena alexandri]